jgi:predicted deacylase
MDDVRRRVRRPGFLGDLSRTAVALLLCACASDEADREARPDPGAHGARSLPASWTATLPPEPSAAPALMPTRPAPAATPFMVGPIVIGHSVEGRPLEVFRFGHGPIRRLIVAGIHGGYEWNTIALAGEFKEHLSQHPEWVPPEITLFLLPALNPDGEARSHSYEGRANARGVDLNRNWPAQWKEDWSRTGCWNHLPIGGGPQPVSEPEVAALMGFILEQRISALISYHSAALGIFAGGRPPSQGSLSLAEAVAEVSPYPYPPLDYGCEYTGQFTDWAAENGIAAIDVELTNHTDTDFEINLQVLQVFLSWRP